MDFAVSNLACRRGELQILSDVSFRIAPGSALILRGPNGAGKTTLLRTIAGLTPPISGNMSFSSDNVAYSGHADGLKAMLSARENLEFWAAVYGADNLADVIVRFDLGVLLNRPAQFLSAGQKRRISLARLLLTGRKLWALDEPTVSLDTQNVARFAQAVNDHLAAGGAAVIATHIDLGLDQADTLDVSRFRATEETIQSDPFLDEALS